MCVFSLRKEAEDNEEAQEAAPPRSVRTDGGCGRFSEVHGHPPPSREASQWEGTAACHPPSKHRPTQRFAFL